MPSPRHCWRRAEGRGRADPLSVRFQKKNVNLGGLLRTPAEGLLAETEETEIPQQKLQKTHVFLKKYRGDAPSDAPKKREIG